MRATIIGFCLAYSVGTAYGQSVPQQSLGNWNSLYPGAMYVAPQDSAFIAPGIYRSLAPAKELSSPIEVSQICMRDFRETKTLKTLFSGISEATGITDVIHKNYAAKLTGLNLSAVKLEGNLELKDETTFTATPLRVLSSDDDIADVILKNIGSGCRDIIKGHLRNGMLIFFAAKAIQAKDFTISINVGPKGSGGFSCSWFSGCPSISADVDRQRQRKRSAVQPVTFAIVPAEIKGQRRGLQATDLR